METMRLVQHINAVHTRDAGGLLYNPETEEGREARAIARIKAGLPGSEPFTLLGVIMAQVIRDLRGRTKKHPKI